ncbi:MAG TPA: hypothetical protein VFZ56_02515 [Gemmatimonadaceae bacterium]
MTRRTRLWLVVAGVVFTFINAGGAVVAAVNGEGGHALTHVALLVATWGVWRFSLSRARMSQPAAELAEQQLDRLEQSVDAIALQMERIGEAQRFMVKVQQQRAEDGSEATARPSDAAS